MLVIHNESERRLLEIDSDLFDEVRDYVRKLSMKKKKSFSYIDEFGDTIVVKNGEEYVIPVREDIEAFHSSDETLDEEEVKRLLGV